MAVLNVSGDIIPNEYKEFYDWLGWDSTAPKDLDGIVAEMAPGEDLTVNINSGGGSLFAGLEIYSKLREMDNVLINVQSLAGSAASIIAMGGVSEISPVAMVMIHRVSGAVSGNMNDMKQMAESLKQMDEGLANAYVEKTHKSKEEILRLMNKETWLTADRAVELGFIDAVSEPKNDALDAVAAVYGLRLTDEIKQRVQAEMAAAEAATKEQEARARIKEELLADLENYGG